MNWMKAGDGTATFCDVLSPWPEAHVGCLGMEDKILVNSGQFQAIYNGQ